MKEIKEHTLDQLNQLISATRLRLRRHSPFFSALALYANTEFTTEVSLAATDGHKLFFNPSTYCDLEHQERDAVFLHELLHAALLHPMRRGTRDPRIFNIAADIVVNGIIAHESPFQLPGNIIRDEELENKSVEEIYEILLKDSKKHNLTFEDLIDENNRANHRKGFLQRRDRDNSFKEMTIEELTLKKINEKYGIEGYWKKAINNCKILTNIGNCRPPSSILRNHLEEISKPRVNWQSMLWRYLVKTPTDFSGFDRRFIHSGLYIENLESEAIKVVCCIDTSGSINEEQLNQFLAELSGIISAYPMISCDLWYADHECYGPYRIESIKEVPRPVGFGGTDFCPFFDAVENHKGSDQEILCVYLTDGFGYYPTEEPEKSVLWVITPGGIDTKDIPFGEVCRISSN